MKRFVKNPFLMIVVVALALTSPNLDAGQGNGGGKPPKDPPTEFDPAIVYVAEKNFNRMDLMLMNADGSNQTVLLEGAKRIGHTQPNWSPDGRFVIYTSNAPDGNGIYSISIEGTGLRRVVPLNHQAGWVRSKGAGPVWSPTMFDGRYWIAYADMSANGTHDLFLVDSDGIDPPIQLTNTSDVNERAPTWSPYATRLAAEFGPTNDGTDVMVYDVVLNPNSPGDISLANPTNVTQAARVGGMFQNELGHPVWSKTDDRISVTVSPDIWVIDLTDSGNPSFANVLLNSDVASRRNHSWSPDGAQIVFDGVGPGNNDNGIYIIDADGLFSPELIAKDGKSIFGLYLPDWRWWP